MLVPDYLTNTRFFLRPSNSRYKICSDGPKSSLPLVIATTTSRPMIRRLRWASALSSPVRLCRYALVGACGAICFQPLFAIVMEARLIIVDKHRGRDVHCVDQTKAFGHAAPTNEFLNFWYDVNESTSMRDFEPKMFSKRFHFREADGS